MKQKRTMKRNKKRKQTNRKKYHKKTNLEIYKQLILFYKKKD